MLQSTRHSKPGACDSPQIWTGKTQLNLSHLSLKVSRSQQHNLKWDVNDSEVNTCYSGHHSGSCFTTVIHPSLWHIDHVNFFTMIHHTRRTTFWHIVNPHLQNCIVHSFYHPQNFLILARKISPNLSTNFFTFPKSLFIYSFKTLFNGCENFQKCFHGAD